MNESILEVLRSRLDALQTYLRWVDLLDIALVAIALYCGLSWLRQRATRSILVALVLFGAVYALARFTEMYLTSYLFEAGFLVIILVLIIAFQEDIRRGLEQLAAWSPLRSRRAFPSRATARGTITDSLVETVVRFAEQSIGALIVLRGHEPLDRHVRGGVPLDAVPSDLLLLSIFEPHSPGHDGAVIIHDDRITHMAAHLPLSNELTRLPSPGTRHAAALGLAERSDALVIAVSEERGVISVAQRGRLEEVTSPTELKTTLQQFRDRIAPAPSTPLWRAELTHRWGLKTASVLCAACLWLLFAFRVETVQRSYVVPVEFRNVPADWSLEHSAVDRVQVSVSGPERAFDLLDPATLVVSVDLSHPQEGWQKLEVTQKNLNVPNGLVVDEIRPRVLEVQMFRMTKVEVAVRPQLVGQPPPSLRLVDVEVEPTRIHVLVRRSRADSWGEIETEPIDLEAIDETRTVERSLNVPETVRIPPEAPTTVQVTLTIAQESSGPQSPDARSPQPLSPSAPQPE